MQLANQVKHVTRRLAGATTEAKFEIGLLAEISRGLKRELQISALELKETRFYLSNAQIDPVRTAMEFEPAWLTLGRHRIHLRSGKGFLEASEGFRARRCMWRRACLWSRKQRSIRAEGFMKRCWPKTRRDTARPITIINRKGRRKHHN